MPFRTPTTIDLTNTRPDMLAGFAYLAPLRDSPTFMALVDDLDGWKLIGADLDDAPFRIDAPTHTLKINTRGLNTASILRSQYFRNTLAFNALCAVRAAWAGQRQAEARAMHRPDLWPLLARIARADTAAMAVRMGFEMLDAGDESLWRHILGDALGDVAMEYARVLEADFVSGNDARALSAAFIAWFEREDRIHTTDSETLAEMDSNLPSLMWNGRGTMSEGAVRCLSVDPLNGLSYLDKTAGDLAGNPSWGDVVHPINQAHFVQIMDEIGTTRVAGLSMRDADLARRLFPDILENV